MTQLDLFMCSFYANKHKQSLAKEQQLQEQLDITEHQLHKLKRQGSFKGRSELEKQRSRLQNAIGYERYLRAIMPTTNDWSDTHIENHADPKAFMPTTCFT